MGYVQTDDILNLNFDLVDYSAFDLNIPIPTPPPMPRIVEPIKKDINFGFLPMEVDI